MACASCSANVERKLQSLEGINEASVSLASRSALVDYDPQRITLEQMKKAINDIGYDLVTESDRNAEEIERKAYRLLQRRTLLSWLFALIVMSLSMGWLSLDSLLAGSSGGTAMGDSLLNNWASLIIALANLIVCGRSFYRSAFKQLMHHSANMDTLVTLSTAIAFLFSTFNVLFGDSVWTPRGIDWHTYFDAATMIITFVLTGRLLEEKAKDGTASSIRELMGMAPKTAHIVDGDKIEEVPISTIEAGDLLEVRPGEKVPVDGEVTWAESFMTPDAAYVDESMITGEPSPAKKTAGSKVLAGTIPSQGKFRMRARQIGEDTALAHIIKMVQEAQGSKAPVQRIVDKASLIFVPVVAGIALLTFILWWAIGGTAALPHAILSAVGVLVIACPCAMGLATPTALMVGIGKAARKNVLIKDATALKPHAREAMEQLQKQGVEIWLMSGDREDAVAYWAHKAGVRHWQSQVKPQDKEDLVRRLQQEGKTVAMMGDGINDTQALALADVSIAIGKGTDVAMDVAQVTLMGDDLQALPEAVSLSRKTVRMIAENLFWAFIYNLVCIPLAAGLLYAFGISWQITPMAASALMALSSVSVVLNSLRLKWIK